MRKKDITIGDEYAVVRTYSEYDMAKPLRGRVLAFDQPRRVYSPGSFTGHTVRDGVLVKLLTDTTGEPLRRFGGDGAEAEPVTIQTRNVLRPWAEQIEVNEKRKEREQEKATYEAEQKRRLAVLNLDLANALGPRGRNEADHYAEFRFVAGFSGPGRYDYSHVIVPIRALERLAELAKERA
jgi:hypothetical protein